MVATRGLLPVDYIGHDLTLLSEALPYGVPSRPNCTLSPIVTVDYRRPGRPFHLRPKMWRCPVEDSIPIDCRRISRLPSVCAPPLTTVNRHVGDVAVGIKKGRDSIYGDKSAPLDRRRGSNVRDNGEFLVGVQHRRVQRADILQALRTVVLLGPLQSGLVFPDYESQEYF